MKAITIKQPWAQLIVDGIKDIENRTWRTNFRGKVLIHTSAKIINGHRDVSNYLTYEQWDSLDDNQLENHLTHGLWITSAIIGEVDIIDCVICHKSIWAEHRQTYEIHTTEDEKSELKPIWNWVLANPVKYDEPFLNVKGKLSFWDFSFVEDCNKLH